MKLQQIHERLIIKPYNHLDTPDEDAETATKLARNNNIYITRNKELSHLAYINDKVVGASWNSISNGEFDFDVVVDKDHRINGIMSARIGPELIKAEMAIWASLDEPIDINLCVVNEKLANWLQKHYGFKPEYGIWSPTTPTMIRRSNQR